eukprot:scaffold85566_cov31-Tisochrysis_lutea.AAC.1
MGAPWWAVGVRCVREALLVALGAALCEAVRRLRRARLGLSAPLDRSAVWSVKHGLAHALHGDKVCV